MNILFNLSNNGQILLVGLAIGILVVLVAVIIGLLVKLRKYNEEVYIPEIKNEEVSTIEKEMPKIKSEIKEENKNKFDINKVASMIEENLENDDDVTKYELEQEEKSIISYEELKKFAQEQKDTGVKVVSFEESQKENKEDKFNTEVLDFSDITSEYKFKPSEFVSPVNGIEKEEINKDILDIESLDDNIKSSSEFLEALKELKKNLD